MIHSPTLLPIQDGRCSKWKVMIKICDKWGSLIGEPRLIGWYESTAAWISNLNFDLFLVHRGRLSPLPDARHGPQVWRADAGRLLGVLSHYPQLRELHRWRWTWPQCAQEEQQERDQQRPEEGRSVRCQRIWQEQDIKLNSRGKRSDVIFTPSFWWL